MAAAVLCLEQTSLIFNLDKVSMTQHFSIPWFFPENMGQQYFNEILEPRVGKRFSVQFRKTYFLDEICCSHLARSLLNLLSVQTKTIYPYSTCKTSGRGVRSILDGQSCLEKLRSSRRLFMTNQVGGHRKLERRLYPEHMYMRKFSFARTIQVKEKDEAKSETR